MPEEKENEETVVEVLVKLTRLERKVLNQLNQRNPKTLTDFRFSGSQTKKFEIIATLLSNDLIKIIGERVVNGNNELLFGITRSGRGALSPVCKYQFKNGRKTNYYCHLRHIKINSDICKACGLFEVSG